MQRACHTASTSSLAGALRAFSLLQVSTVHLWQTKAQGRYSARLLLCDGSALRTMPQQAA